MSKELLKRVRDTLHELEETHYDLYWDIQTALDQPEPSITAREMYQRGYAAAERDLKREPLSIDWAEAPENTAIAKVALFWVTEDNLMLGRKDLMSIEKPVEGDAK